MGVWAGYGGSVRVRVRVRGLELGMEVALGLRFIKQLSMEDDRYNEPSCDLRVNWFIGI